MFNYSFSYKGKEGTLKIGADSEESVPFKYEFDFAKDFDKNVRNVIDLSMTPLEIFSKFSSIPSMKIKSKSSTSRSSSEDNGETSSSEDKVGD